MTEAVARAGLRDWLSLVKFSHTVFALPFALIALLVAADGRPEASVLGLVVLPMASRPSVILRTSGPRPAISEIPPALSAMGP